MQTITPLIALAIAAATAMFSAAVSGAQVTKCVDASGRVVAYGSECPAGTRAEATGIRNAPAASAPAQQPSLAERDAEFRKRQIEKHEAAAKAAQQSAEAREQRQACDEARAYLKGLQAGHRIPRTDPKTGERSYLGDADYPKEIARAQRVAAANCK
jgi:hypothetical protein